MEYLKNIFYSLIIWIEKDKKPIMLSLAAGLCLSLLAAAVPAYSDAVQASVAQKVVRFHVRANSNSPEDVALKLNVRDAVLKAAEPLMKKCSTAEEGLRALRDNKDVIQAAAEDELRLRGSDYKARVFVSKDLFPLKKYDGLTFPTGEYNALRVEIGSGEGDNWWCVMFPPMCFIETDFEYVPSEGKDAVKSMLTTEEYGIISYEESGEAAPEIKFKLVEWWQELKAGDTAFVTNK